MREIRGENREFRLKKKIKGGISEGGFRNRFELRLSTSAFKIYQ
jgi:hypothetical protein